MSAPSTVLGAVGAPVENALLSIIPLCPLIGAAVVYFLTKRAQQVSGWVATLAAFASFLVTVSVFRSLPAQQGSAVVADAWQWIQVGDFSANMAFRMDHLSAVMTLVVTGVGTLIHLYAIGYMSEDESKARFFTYLNLFLCAMLLLVLGDNLLVMFVGWEGVGLCSYLLIGFWHKEMPNAEAGQKAFVVNRIGDAGFLLGLFTLFITTGSIDFTEIQQSVGAIPPGALEFIAFALFIGAMGKSAQIPLYVWLPDAMAGPTPVSALIHAATMVTAGVYMIARLGFLFALAPNASVFICVVGALTAIVAASIALVQNDIKKVLAYSTVSQLGYMFMAMGAGAYSNGIFHVVTHAFFKALLFMAAGSVITGTHHEQDMRHFGGLRKYMPVTFWTYLVATLAIAGVPFLSGFYSKDAILWSVFAPENPASRIVLFGGVGLNHLLWGVGFVTAGMTAFYMTRSLVLTFFGSYRGHAHPHESPWVVVVPLAILALPSAFFGKLFGKELIQFLAPWTRADMLHIDHSATYLTLEYLSIAIALLGIALAYFVYAKKPAVAKGWAERFPGVYQKLLNKWWVDEVYDRFIVRPLAALALFFFRGVDRAVIDASVNGTALLIDTEGEVTSSAHSGQIGHYLVAMFLGMIVLTVFWLLLG